jgi:hypothetical protein
LKAGDTLSQTFYKIFTDTHLNYYTDMPVDVGDTIVVEAQGKALRCKVEAIINKVDFDPFDPSSHKEHGVQARCHVLENTTKKIYYKESIIMFGYKVVEVKHVGSNRTGLFYTDLDLKKGDIVVYEAPANYMEEHDELGNPNTFHRNKSSYIGMHVGEIIDDNPDSVTAKCYVVDKVDTAAHEARKQRMVEANKLRAQLNEKKKQLEDIKLLELIAQSDPETKSMLDQYKALLSGTSPMK